MGEGLNSVSGHRIGSLTQYWFLDVGLVPGKAPGSMLLTLFRRKTGRRIVKNVPGSMTGAT
jgi:hypothetical protein